MLVPTGFQLTLDCILSSIRHQGQRPTKVTKIFLNQNHVFPNLLKMFVPTGFQERGSEMQNDPITAEPDIRDVCIYMTPMLPS